MTQDAQEAELFDKVRGMLVITPPISWEEIASIVGVDDVDGLVNWFLSCRPAAKPKRIENRGYVPRDPSLRAEYRRLRDREASLLTVATEAPAQLATVQRRLASLGRAR
jgi:hypothetical protein